jgi:hypothetical protein
MFQEVLMSAATKVNPFTPKATNKGGNFEQAPAGNHVGMLVALIDEGTHWDSYRDQAEKKVRKIVFVFEVEAEKDGKDKRYWLGQEYSMGYDDQGGLVMGKKSNLRKLMEGWSGKAYGDGEVPDFTKALGRTCVVNVIHEQSGENSYARIASVSKPPKGVPEYKPERAPFSFVVDSKDQSPGAKDTDVTEWLPRIYGEKIHAIVGRCLERGGSGKKGASNKPIGENGETGNGFAYGANAQQQPTTEQQAEEVF